MSNAASFVPSAVPAAAPNGPPEERYAVRVLGSVTINGDYGSSKGSRQLLALLVVGGASGVEPERLATNIWGQSQPGDPRNTLSRAVSRLRRLGLPVDFVDGRYVLALPAESVDAWHLSLVVASGSLDRLVVSELLAESRPFGDVGSTVDLDAEADRLRQLQRDLIARAHDEALDLTGSTLGRLGDHLEWDPFDPELLEHLVGLNRRAGALASAREVLARARRFRGPGTWEDIDHLAELIDGDQEHPSPSARPTGVGTSTGSTGSTGVETEQGRHRREARVNLPERLARYRSASLIGRDELLVEVEQALDADTPAVVCLRGPAGVGKTSLLAELATRRGQQSMIVDLVGRLAETAPLSALSTAFPDVSSGSAAEIMEVLQHRARGRAVLLVVDDAQWLDAQTCSVLHSLLLVDRADLRLDGLLLATRDDGTSRGGPSRQLIAHASRVTTPTLLDVTPLTVDDLAGLVGLVETDVSLRQRHQRAVWLHRVTGGIPEVALRLIEAGCSPGADPDALGRANEPAEMGGALSSDLPLLATPESTEALGAPAYSVGELGPLYGALIKDLDEAGRLVGLAAAVLGRRFRLSDLSELIAAVDDAAILDSFHRDRSGGYSHGLDEDQLFDLVDELVSAKILEETGSLDHYEFSHDLLVDAFLVDVDSERLSELHLLAAKLADDVHAVARHQLGAAILLPPQQVLAAVLASAANHLEHREFWASVVAFRQAISLVGVSGLPVRAQVDYASALALAGTEQESEAARRRAHAAAVAVEDWELAVAAACAGLPEAETADGEQDRVDLLLDISAEKLGREARFDQAVTIARQATRIGEQDLANAWAARAEAAAKTDEERLLGALAVRWATRSTVRAQDRQTHLTGVVADLRGDDRRWSEVPSQHRATAALFAGFDALELYDLAGAQVKLAEAKAAGTEDFASAWRVKLFDALVLEVQGRVAEAEARADEALRFGQRHGVAVAEVARLAMAFNRRDSFGQLAEFAGLLNAVPEPDASVLYLASLVRLAEVSNQVDTAVQMAEDLAVRVLDRPLLHFQALPVLGSSLARSHRTDLRRRAMEVLEPYDGTAMVAGMGIGILPSITATLMLLDDGFDRTEIAATKQAIADADRGGFLPWSIRYRLDLAASVGSASSRDEAIDLARGTELWPTVAPQVGLQP